MGFSHKGQKDMSINTQILNDNNMTHLDSPEALAAYLKDAGENATSPMAVYHDKNGTHLIFQVQQIEGQKTFRYFNAPHGHPVSNDVAEQVRSVIPKIELLDEGKIARRKAMDSFGNYNSRDYSLGDAVEAILTPPSVAVVETKATTPGVFGLFGRKDSHVPAASPSTHKNPNVLVKK